MTKKLEILAARVRKVGRREAAIREKNKREHLAKCRAYQIEGVMEERAKMLVKLDLPPDTERTGRPEDMPPPTTREYAKHRLGFGVRVPETAVLARFGNALREVLGLEPLYESDETREVHDPAQKFLVQQRPWTF